MSIFDIVRCLSLRKEGKQYDDKRRKNDIHQESGRENSQNDSRGEEDIRRDSGDADNELQVEISAASKASGYGLLCLTNDVTSRNITVSGASFGWNVFI